MSDLKSFVSPAAMDDMFLRRIVQEVGINRVVVCQYRLPTDSLQDDAIRESIRRFKEQLWNVSHRNFRITRRTARLITIGDLVQTEVSVIITAN